MAHRRHSGFTLVELLVVITIIGMLMSLLLPAVNAVRENARRTTCANQMQQLAKATFSFVTTKDYFPGYRGNRAGSKVIIQDTSWFVAIAPQVERSDIKDRYDEMYLNKSQFPFIEFLVCPSDPAEQLTWTPNNPPSHLSYVANAGRADRTNTTPVNQPQNPSALPPDLAANGVFHDLSKQKAPKLSIPFKDGITNTLMLSENIQATKWSHYGGSGQIDEYEVGFVFGAGSPFDNAQFDNNGEVTDPARRINGLRASAPEGPRNGNPPGTPRPSSNHPGGVNVAFCDGRTMFLKEDIGYWVYQQLMTPDGAQSDVAPPGNKNYILNSADYTSQ